MQSKYLIFLLFLLLCGCHSDDNNVSERIFTVSIEYEDGFVLYIDDYARLYVYYDIYSTDIADYTYSLDGTLMNKDQLITPDMMIASDKQGNIALKLESTRKITIIAESSYYTDKRIIQSYSPDYSPIADIYIFRE
mgnify:FL=1